MKTFNQALHNIWFQSVPATRLAMLRILLGLFVLWYLVPEKEEFLEVAKTDVRLFAPVGVIFHGAIGPELFIWLYNATLIATLLFTLGLWHRAVGPVFAGLLLWLFCYRNSWSMIYHSDNLVVLHAIVLGLTRCADAWSLDALFRDREGKAYSEGPRVGWQYDWPARLMCGLTVSAYFVTAVAKLASPLGLAWMTGENLRAQMAVDGIRKELLGSDPNAVAYALYDWLPLFTLLAAGTIVLELFAPLALLNRRLGRYWAVSAYFMHWGILWIMHITFHYQLTGIMFAAFFPVELIIEWPRKFWRRRMLEEDEETVPEPATRLAPQESVSRATLYYDGQCGMCDRFVQFVLQHDPRGYFQFATLQSEAGGRQLSRLGLSPSDLKTVILVEGERTSLRSTATLRVCRRLSGLWPILYGFSLVPTPLRDGVYSLVARYRRRWFKPPAECPVMPPEWRRRFVG